PAHPAPAGPPLGAYGDIPLGAGRFDAERHDDPARPGRRPEPARSPYHAYRVSQATRGSARGAVAALVRDPRSSMQIWSRHQGYPGDEWYLEFHKIRWPGGLKLWRVSGGNVDLGAKRAYEPHAALDRVKGHASHFAHLLESIAQEQPEDGAGALAAPCHTVLAQAARELLLAQASDWQFIISTGAVVDYAERRFTLHCDDAERLIKTLVGGELEAGRRLAEELARRDDLFPDVLAQVAEALNG